LEFDDVQDYQKFLVQTNRLMEQNINIKNYKLWHKLKKKSLQTAFHLRKEKTHPTLLSAESL
jgi:hypothetical protein